MIERCQHLLTQGKKDAKSTRPVALNCNSR
jgi:hypothetical protein